MRTIKFEAEVAAKWLLYRTGPMGNELVPRKSDRGADLRIAPKTGDSLSAEPTTSVSLILDPVVPGERENEPVEKRIAFSLTRIFGDATPELISLFFLKKHIRTKQLQTSVSYFTPLQAKK